MFSKALFKQSCKANGTMWLIITFTVCFMLACVMLISGSGSIGEVRDSIQDTIIVKEVDSQMEKRALSYYETADNGLARFDLMLSDNLQDNITYLVWCSNMPADTDYDDISLYYAAVQAWQDAMPEMKTDSGKSYAAEVSSWMSEMPVQESFQDINDYLAAVGTWQEKSPATQEAAVAAAYLSACEELQSYISEAATEAGYDEGSAEAQEMLGCVMYTLNPNGSFDSFYTENGEDIPEDYDFVSLVSHISNGDIVEYLSSAERADYRHKRADECTAIFLAGNMTKAENTEALIDALSSYGVTAEKFDSFGYTYASIKHMAKNAVVTYQGRLEYELDLLDGQYTDETAYTAAVEEKKAEIAESISASFLSTLPVEVSEALEEIGALDLYTLIVGSIFYKLAGLLLPIIYMIMASNNLIAGQVDSGSMAYVLSTSTRRSTVAFTQAVYLIGSLFAMFSFTTATSCVCLSLVSEEVDLTYGKLTLLNLGAFLVLLALSGLCFFTSCVFDRSKRSMAIGGGLSIFALVAAMLGLFGSPVIPSVVRLTALNYFNYATIISLFDVISIIDGSNAFILKFAILGIAGILGYIAGSIRFTKKDLPL